MMKGALVVLVFVASAYSAEATSAQSYLQTLNKQFKKYNNPRKNPAKWKPKIAGTDTTYDGKNRDWASVVSACRSAVRYEKRLGNFIIRSCFHDSLAVDVRACQNGNEVNSMCGGADSSLYLSEGEMFRPENSYDKFSEIAARVLKKIASFYDISVSDTMAVCGAVAIEELSNGRVKIMATGNLPIGRLDSYVPSPPGNLPADTADEKTFNQWWRDRGFSVREAIALLGSHALIDDQGCIKGPGTKDHKCNPKDKSCIPRMFKWENHFYHDACTPSLSISDKVVPEKTPKQMGPKELQNLQKETQCKFTSKWGKQSASTELALELTGQSSEAPEAPPKFSVDWSNKGCAKGASFGASKAYCIHTRKWHYTVNDAYNGLACQGKGEKPNQEAMRAFLNQNEWDRVLIPAYIKMVSKYANYNVKNVNQIQTIDGTECRDFQLDVKCVARNPSTAKNKCAPCKGKGKCPQCCRCSTLFQDGFAMSEIMPQPVEAPEPPTLEEEELDAVGVDALELPEPVEDINAELV